MMRVMMAAMILSAGVGNASPADAPLIVAHRGASADAPENTLPAFELAWRQGADAIEGDFYLTRDGAIVCLHDRDTKRVAGVDLKVAESSLEELRRLDVGLWRGEQWRSTRIPTLAEVFATIPAGKRLYLEVKCGPEILVRLLEEIGRSRLEPWQIVIISFHAEVIAGIERLAPQYKTCWLSGFKEGAKGEWTPTAETVLATLDAIRADGFSSSHAGVQPALIRRVQSAGFEYHVWTVDDPEIARRFREWGALSITTNVPGLLRQALGLALPADGGVERTTAEAVVQNNSAVAPDDSSASISPGGTGHERSRRVQP